ncbi:MAG: NRDE family protein [Oryzomonas sp.]|uniref:NRDE family protein n=1 Tax=Oryzomonas sp. TaxID=2855186 RepID=UPI00283E584C|nr:NRDE family protein [Oryzomonas sp.]MDR3581286.1 NRDE family protein [Oryzomonas sp.]
MCLIVFALDIHPRYRLIMAANRDEFHVRPTLAAAYWSDFPHVLAGRDLLCGGTWLGVTTNGRLAAVTNFRDPARDIDTPRFSRGDLPSGYLTKMVPPQAYLETLPTKPGDYNGFNLIVSDREELWYYSNRGNAGPMRVAPGIHGLSNHLLDTPWPKVTTSKDSLEHLLREDRVSPEEVLELLSDTTPFPEHLLPDTGVGRERERMLSPRFISGDTYGTRSSTVILVEPEGGIYFMERSYAADRRVIQTIEFNLPARDTGRIGA